MPEVKWTREVSLLTNYYMVMDVLFVILFGGAGLGFILFLIMGASEIYAILQIITLATGILIVLSFLTMGIIMLNNVELTFTINEKGIKTVLGKNENLINKITLFFGLITGKLGLMGTSILAMSREQTFVEWSEIQKAVMDDKKKIISLSSGRRMLVRLFCDPDTYSETVGYVEKMIPDAQLKRF